MMRLAVVILGLVTIAVGLVHIRRQEASLGHEQQTIQSRHSRLRREIWQREADLGTLTTPKAVQQRAEWLGLDVSYSASIRRQQASTRQD